jgi:hypothetical protein
MWDPDGKNRFATTIKSKSIDKKAAEFSGWWLLKIVSG